MPAKEKKPGGAERRANRVLELKEPPMGYLQAVILKKLDELGDDAFGYKVLEELMVDTGEWIDPSQVYNSMRKLMDEKRKFIEYVGTRRSPDGGPPLKIYRVTAAGRAAIKAAGVHHRALADYLEK